MTAVAWVNDRLYLLVHSADAAEIACENMCFKSGLLNLGYP